MVDEKRESLEGGMEKTIKLSKAEWNLVINGLRGLVDDPAIEDTNEAMVVESKAAVLLQKILKQVG